MATVYKGWNQATIACRAPMRGVLETRGSWLSSREGGALTRMLEPVTMTLQLYQGFPLFIPEDLKVKTQLWWGMSWDWEFSVSCCVGRWAISPHVHGSQPLYVLSLHSCSRIASRSNLFLSLLVFMFSCHSQLILELSSSMKSNKRRSFNELLLVFIFLSGETHVHLWKRSPIPVSQVSEGYVSPKQDLSHRRTELLQTGPVHSRMGASALKCDWASFSPPGMALACILWLLLQYKYIIYTKMKFLLLFHYHVCVYVHVCKITTAYFF